MTRANELFSLADKAAVVVGGTGELCGAMAEALAYAGARVALVGRSAKKAEARIATIKKAGGSACFIAADVATRNGIEDLLADAREKLGQCDILVNGAGINSATPFFEVSDEEFDDIIGTNVRSVFIACQVFGKYFVDNNVAASIINVGSMSGITPLSRVFSYSMSKAAVHNLSKNLAREWATKDIRVNTIVPGFFPAEQNRKVLTDSRVAQIMGHTPMKRFGEASELAGATLLLASGAGSFMTGAELLVDGGFAAMTL